MAGYDLTTGEIRLWWSQIKRERRRCGDRRRDGGRCQAPPVWDRRRDRPVNGRCRMHGGLSTGPKTEDVRRLIAGSNRARAALSGEVGRREAVTQRGIAP